MVSADIPEHLKRLEIPGKVAFQEGKGDLPKLEVRSASCAAEIYLHGAHVTEVHPDHTHPLLFTSQFSRFERHQPIRGGVPIIFPWFGAREGEPMHGFARISDWNLHEATATPEGGVSLRFSLPETPEGGIWPSFTANYTVTLTDRLRLELIVTNTSPQHDFSFENCLHSYLAVGEIHQVTIAGLKGLSYLDKVDNFTQKTEATNAIKVASEMDRVFLDAPGRVEIADRAWKRKIIVEKSGSASTVLWNPWSAKSQQMPDFGSDEYLRMICVESGNVSRNKLILKPGQSSTLSVTLSSAPLT